MRQTSPSPLPKSPLPPPVWLRQAGDHVEVEVLVSPRASRSQVVGLHDGRLKIQLAAPPVDGAANEALLELVVKLLGVPRRAVTLLRGDASRRKTVAVEGSPVAHIITALLGEAA